ncbi:MAG: response regulator [archaeon]|nr:response regulator [Nanoarchaeota archaeon]
MGLNDVNKRLIFAIDDQREITEIIRKIGAGSDLEVRTFISANPAAYQITNGVKPGMIITDESLPGMSGLELCAITKYLSPSTCRVLHTSHSLEEPMYEQAGKDRVYDHFLAKPCTMKHLQEILDGYKSRLNS